MRVFLIKLILISILPIAAYVHFTQSPKGSGGYDGKDVAGYIQSDAYWKDVCSRVPYPHLYVLGSCIVKNPDGIDVLERLPMKGK